MLGKHKHGIKTVAIQTGLTQYTIRAWEKRYNVVVPLRTATNRRLYTDTDISRLTLLRRAAEAGHSIGSIANLQSEELLKLIGPDSANSQEPSFSSARTAGSKQEVSEEVYLRSCITSCITSMMQFEARTLEATLFRASVVFSQPVFLEKLIMPLMQEIGELWSAGTIRIAHEHLVSAVVRTLLGNIWRGYEIAPSMPNLVLSTPRGQFHEIGALIAGTTAASQGWQVTYLGPNLPAAEIVGCAEQKAAKAIGLSIIYPTDEQDIANELRQVRHGVQDDVALFVGGSGSIAYSSVIKAIGAVRIDDMQTFRTELETLCVQKNSTEANVS